MQLEKVADGEALAQRGVELIAEFADRTLESKPTFTLAVSGGSTPRRMLELLAGTTSIDWPRVHLFQVDERIAPTGDPDRNLAMLQPLLSSVELGGFYPMPVSDTELVAACSAYAASLATVAGSPPVLDLVQLGLGSDGHTASLIPGDPILHVEDTDVATTGEYQGRKRMTFTWPVLDRAAAQLWLIGGASKHAALGQLLTGDPSIPATLPSRDRATVVADQAACTGEPA